METMIHPNSNSNFFESNQSETNIKSLSWAVPLGRFFYSLIFITSGLNHFSGGTISYAAQAGVPMAEILVPLSGVIAMVGGISVMLGFHARMGALLLLLFLIPVTFIMHNFWAIPNPQEAQTQMAHFMKNISMIGGAMLVIFYGAGPKSLDNRKPKVIKAP